MIRNNDLHLSTLSFRLFWVLRIARFLCPILASIFLNVRYLRIAPVARTIIGDFLDSEKLTK